MVLSCATILATLLYARLEASKLSHYRAHRGGADAVLKMTTKKGHCVKADFVANMMPSNKEMPWAFDNNESFPVCCGRFSTGVQTALVRGRD